MQFISKQSLTAVIATAALVGAIAGQLLASPTSASSQSFSSGTCRTTACINHTWLWLPAMRRAR